MFVDKEFKGVKYFINILYNNMGGGGGTAEVLE